MHGKAFEHVGAVDFEKFFFAPGFFDDLHVSLVDKVETKRASRMRDAVRKAFVAIPLCLGSYQKTGYALVMASFPQTNPILPQVLILDVDGVLTSGHFYYTVEGKVMKVFGADDNDALSLLVPHLAVRFITGDRKGFAISKKRIVDDMKFPLDLVSTVNRVEWIAERYALESVIYMGDGIFDHYVMKSVGYSIAPSNADRLAKEAASYVTERPGGDRAVAEASLHILEKFFKPYDPTAPVAELKRGKGGEWGGEAV